MNLKLFPLPASSLIPHPRFKSRFNDYEEFSQRNEEEKKILAEETAFQAVASDIEKLLFEVFASPSVDTPRGPQLFRFYGYDILEDFFEAKQTPLWSIHNINKLSYIDGNVNPHEKLPLSKLLLMNQPAFISCASRRIISSGQMIRFLNQATELGLMTFEEIKLDHYGYCHYELSLTPRAKKAIDHFKTRMDRTREKIPAALSHPHNASGKITT